MSDDLNDHTPSGEQRRRAEAAGFDLDALRRSDPTTYKMLCSQPVVRVDSALAGLADAPLQAALPQQQLFQAQQSSVTTILAFPGPDAEELERLDQQMGELAESELHRFVYYRVVRDTTGTRRELSLPVEPAAWSGELRMVGPFRDQGEADAWGRDNVMGRDVLTFDTVPYGAAWFCDVFRADLG